MKQIMILVMDLMAPCQVATVTAAPADKAGCKDHSLFPTRMPDYRIESCKHEAFGACDFQAAKGPKNRVEGKTTIIIYTFTGPRESEPSGLAVVRNYGNAVQAVGGDIVQTDPERWVNARIGKDGQETRAEVFKGNGKIWLRIVKEKPMEQTIVADAVSLSNDIRATGHTAVYGIYFDTAKATIKPDSAHAVAEIGKLLSADLGLKVFVVGHTGNQGGADSNLKLSRERGEAVLESLAHDHGIAAARLGAYGCGRFAPVSSNDTEDGRAKNRRVELVKQ
jgi:OmpA-OmpF porin, OOP family